MDQERGRVVGRDVASLAERGVVVGERNPMLPSRLDTDSREVLLLLVSNATLRGWLAKEEAVLDPGPSLD